MACQWTFGMGISPGTLHDQIGRFAFAESEHRTSSREIKLLSWKDDHKEISLLEEALFNSVNVLVQEQGPRMTAISDKVENSRKGLLSDKNSIWMP